MGQEARAQLAAEIPLNLTKEEMQSAKERFNQLDRDRKGHITVNDIRRHFREHGNKIDERLLHELLNEVDLNKNGELDLAEFFQVKSPFLKINIMIFSCILVWKQVKYLKID